MALVTVTLNGRKYEISCDDGQEAHLEKLAAYVDSRVAELVGAVGNVGDSQLLAMAGLVIADDLSEALAERDALKAAGKGASDRVAAQNILGAAMNSLAQRIEHIADRLEQA